MSHLLFLYCFVPCSCHSLHPVEHEFYEGNEYLSSLPADADRAEDFEYEVGWWAHFTLSFCSYRYGIYTADCRLLWEKEKCDYFLKIITKGSFVLYLCDVTGYTGVRLKMWNLEAELCNEWLHTSLGGLLNMFCLCAVETATQMLLFSRLNTLNQDFPHLQMVTGSLIVFLLLPLILRIKCPCISYLRNQYSRYLGMCLSVCKIMLQIGK